VRAEPRDRDWRDDLQQRTDEQRNRADQAGGNLAEADRQREGGEIAFADADHQAGRGAFAEDRPQVAARGGTRFAGGRSRSSQRDEDVRGRTFFSSDGIQNDDFFLRAPMARGPERPDGR
jgi:hypothetical protein